MRLIANFSKSRLFASSIRHITNLEEFLINCSQFLKKFIYL
jgi:hypothetical protein